jgi:hypothetical protein
VDPSGKVVADNNEQVKGILMRLYKDNDWLIEEQIPIVPKTKGKFAKNTYYLGEFASIMSKKQRQISPSIKDRVDKDTDWLAILNSIAEKYGDRIESQEIKVKSANPRGRTLDMSVVDSMTGLGYNNAMEDVAYLNMNLINFKELED